MPLLDPLNDQGCLLQLHQRVLEFKRTAEARQLASQFTDLDELITYIRALSQRDDHGDPDDGPRVLCDVTQRLRLPADDPNCFERLALFLAIALLIDPDIHLTSTTMMLDNGLHSFPVEIREGIPGAVVLDPITSPPLNAMNAAAYQTRNASPMNTQYIAPWFADLAYNACLQQGAEDCYEIAMDSIRNSLLTGRPIDAPEEIDSVLALAYPDACLFGAKGETAYERVRRSVRNLSIGVDARRVSGFLNGLIHQVEPLASKAIKTALIAQFGPAAAIALQGLDVAVAEKPTPQKEDPNDEQYHHETTGSLNLKLESSEPVSKRQPLTDEQRQQRLRRMTFAFRQPDNSEES